MKKFTKKNLGDYSRWPKYRKQHLIQATRVIGPFEVETREGTLTCNDGWLAIDSDGHPYPVAAEEFDKIYESEYGDG